MNDWGMLTAMIVRANTMAALPRQWRRRDWLLAAAAAPAALAGCQVRARQPVLRVLAWPGYADLDWIQAFEQRHGARVEFTIIGSDDMLRANLSRPADGGVDVVAANTVELAALLAQGRLLALDPGQLPLRAGQLPRFRQPIAGTAQDGQLYAVPFTYSEMGLIYDRRQLEAPPSLGTLWDRRWQGRVLFFDGSAHAFSLAAQARGWAPFALQPAQFPALARDLVQLRRNLLALYRLPEEPVELWARHAVALMHANYGQQQLKMLRDAGHDVGYVVPREGALAWLDAWAVLRTTQQPQLAQQWINHMLDPAVGAEFSRRQGLANTLQEPSDLDAASLHGPIVWLEPVEDEDQRQRWWRRIVAGDRLQGVV